MKRGMFIIIFDNELEHFEINLKKREKLITIRETEETLCEGTFGALSVQNILFLVFLCTKFEGS